MINYKRSDAPTPLRLSDGEAGLFTGYASIFDAVDDQGDRVERGAFARSLKESAARGQPPALLWQHDPGEPIGVWEQLREDSRGLACVGRLCLETRRGAEAHALMKLGALSGLSIGYRVRVAGRDSASGVRRLLDVELLEISPVTFPALAAARVATVTATINTTASPGTIVQNDVNGRDAFLMDAVRATSTTPTFTTRASRYENLPDDDVVLYLFIWSYNGTVAPASTTTWTLGFVAVEKFANTPVFLQGVRANGAANPIPVAFPAAQPVSGTVTANIGTGSIAAGTNLIGDVGNQYRASATGGASAINYASPATPAGTSIKGSAGRLIGLTLVNTSAGVRWVKIFNATAVTMGTTSALVDFPIPAGQSIVMKWEGGIGFATGIMIAVTAARGVTDNTATGLALGDVAGFAVFA